MDKTFDFAAAEPRIYEAWDKAGAFAAGAGKRRDETYCILLPPPNVTGVLHAGHAFNHTLMDILVRWKRMQGYDTLFQPGLDHAGIATQLVVERQLAEQGIARSDLSREEFRAKVWEWKATSGGQIVEQDKRLGTSMDWSRLAFTMDGAEGQPGGPDGPNFHEAVIRVFVDLYDKGLIYRGKRLVNWDPHFETAISDLEVENSDTDGHMWHFKYPLAGGARYTYTERDADGRVVFEEERDYISIATTRPETMLGDGAVAVHPDDARYAPIVGQLCEIPVGPEDQRRLIPIITDPYPDPAFGSGAVKITGAHDFNDYAVAQRNGIPLYRLLDTTARMRADGLSYDESAALAGRIARGEIDPPADVGHVNLVPDDLRGLDRYDARARIVAEITEKGLAMMVPETDPRLGEAAARTPLAAEEGGEAPEARRVPLVEAKTIMQPYGDRSKVVIEPLLTDQWFVDTAKIVGPALDAVRSGETEILPEAGRKTYFHWLENIEPWCISRQLWWGHRIPVWYGLDIDAGGFRDDEGDRALDEVEIRRLLAEDAIISPVDRSHSAGNAGEAHARFVDVLSQLPEPLRHARVEEVADRPEATHRFAASLARYATTQDPTQLVYPVWQDPDVLDTWFSSGLWPIGTLGWPTGEWAEFRRYHPTSVLVTGQDILFFWVARMMMMQLAVIDEKPFDTVYLHGLVRDAKGQKMSKTLGNVLDPIELIDQFGADALRFTNAAIASQTGTIRLSTDRIKGYRNFGTKLWNAARFAEMNDCRPDPDFDPAAASQTVNRWIVGETGRARAALDAHLAEYRFDDAARGLYQFVWNVVCDWYVEFAKPLLDDADSRAETQATMAWVIDQCLILLHPMMPFITEELWGQIAPRDRQLIVQTWPDYGEDLVDPQSEAEMRWVIALIEEVRSVRSQMHVPVGARVPLIRVAMDAVARGRWDRNAAIIQRLARIPEVREADAMPQGAATLTVEGATLGLPLADIIDVAAEKARLQKSRDKLGKEVGGLRGRLDNPNFVASAPPEVVEETRANLAAREDEAGQIDAALARLRALAAQ